MPTTKRQQEVLDMIEKLTTDNGMRPTFREVAKPFGFTPNGIMCHLDALQKKGLVRWEPTLSRTLQIIPQPEKRGMPLVTLEQLSRMPA